MKRVKDREKSQRLRNKETETKIERKRLKDRDDKKYVIQQVKKRSNSKG